ncbi:hypothetical protein Y032_0599g475 [Ancylostoma ceylanicum]|uniref:Uncharacterized protein n=1 Tax=Ancylostoma ceylanicum TaxID=53326 RepID=A0A016WNZ7_9BILA|nr:hypothetical protein Y032_0599g475 [Ancylostoma ceylanicum]
MGRSYGWLVEHRLQGRRRDFRRAPHAYAYRNQPLSTWTSRYDRVNCLVELGDASASSSPRNLRPVSCPLAFIRFSLSFSSADHLPVRFHISPSHPEFFQSEECGYCCLTVIALSIAFCSAVITFLVANHMYTGLPCHDDPQPFALKNEELSWDGSDRLVVASKGRVHIARCSEEFILMVIVNITSVLYRSPMLYGRRSNPDLLHIGVSQSADRYRMHTVTSKN